MAESTAKTAVSASAVSVIATVIFGWFAASNFSSQSGKPMVPPASPSVADSRANASLLPRSIQGVAFNQPLALRPLRDAVFGAGSERGTTSLQALRSELERSGRPTLRFLLASVPDPVASSLSFRFDETIDSIQGAARSFGYVLERWRLPWSEQREHANPKTASEKQAPRQTGEVPPPDQSSLSFQPIPGDPGLLVFRRTGFAPNLAMRQSDLLLVFLITETPTHGVDRLALTRSLELAEALQEPRESNDFAPLPIRIIAPCFSGSMPSLRDALRDWLVSINEAETKRYAIDIMSGTASAFARTDFLGAIREGSFKNLKEISFFTTTHHFESTLDVLLRFLRRSRNDKDVAILSEIDSGFGESVSRFPRANQLKSDKGTSSISLQYPSQIAEIRRRYESEGLMRGGASDVFRAVSELRGRDDAQAKARDVFPNQTPDWTAVAENRVLMQTLSYLEDSHFKVIGIIGTDPRDTIFLVRLVQRYCPDARVFTVGPDLIYLDPQSIADLRGMIIGSTYPLYAANHSWTGSDSRSRGQVFPSESAQGVYNAAVVQIARLTGVESGQEGKHLLEYSTPVALRNGVAFDSGLPPVWVSIVGERSLYPVDCSDLASDALSPDRDYLYHARSSGSRPTRLVIYRPLAWVVFLAAASLSLIIPLCRRLIDALRRPGSGPDRRRTSMGEMALTLVRVLIVAGYLFVACPALAQPVPGTVQLNLAGQSSSWIFLAVIFLMPIVVTLGSLLAPVAEFHAGQSAWRIAEVVGVALVVLMVGWVQVACAASAWWVLSLNRSTAITGGVSAHVPAAFLMAGLAAWLYSRRRISTINDTFGFTPEDDPPPGPVSDTYWAVLRRTAVHRARFDRWFIKPGDLFRPFHGTMISLAALRPALVAAALLTGMLIDSLVFRPISWSDEGRLFDLVFRLAFGLMLALFAMNFARLHSVWHDLRAVLDGFAKTLTGALDRIPNKVSSWLVDTGACDADYGHLIRLQISAARKLLAGWDVKMEPPKTSVIWDTDLALRQLAVLEQHLDENTRSRLGNIDDQVTSFRYFARTLSARWTDAPAGRRVTPEIESKHHEKAEPTREEKVIDYLEELLALEAARWVGGALARVWTTIGFLAFSAVALLFAITSYPFPEQSRVMTAIGLAIAALVVMILRVAIGSSRDEVISKIGGTAPGRISWNATLFSTVATYVVPLLGLLAAVSFELLDLFRSVLGPILRVFP